jgi:hypothetical protein
VEILAPIALRGLAHVQLQRVTAHIGVLVVRAQDGSALIRLASCLPLFLNFFFNF